MPPGEHLDLVIADLAERQHGVVSRRQLMAAGASNAAIEHRLALRRLHRIHRGVYAAGHTPLPAVGRYQAAVLACGAGAVLSHRAAAAMLDLRHTPVGPVDVTVPRRGTRRKRDIVIHTTRWLPKTQVILLEGIPCTSPARTIADLAAIETEREQRRLLEQSLVLQLFDARAFDEVLAGGNGRRGTGSLRGLLDELNDEPAPTRSELERLLLELVRATRLELPVVNGYVEGLQVDFHWPRCRVVVEVDGRRYHGHTIGIERDRNRDLRLQLAGWRVIRLTWRQIVNEPERVAHLLRRLLSP